MTRLDFPDETLMRFADGELDADTASKVEQALETDDDLASQVALFIETRLRAKAALKPLLDEPVPEQLAAAVERMVEEKRAKASGERVANIVPFRRVQAGQLAKSGWVLPLAASLAAVLGGLGGYWLALNGNGTNATGLQVAGINSPALGEALATVASGKETELTESGQRFRVIATFRDKERVLCREFELDSPDRNTVISVACHSDGKWGVHFAVVAPSNQTGYAPASSTEALDAYLSAIHAEDPLSAEEETQALGEIQ